MKPVTVVLIVIAVAVIIGFIAYSFYLSPVEHSVTFYFHDGSTSTIPLMDIAYEQKTVDRIQYRVDSDYDLLQYTPYFDTPMGTYQLEPTSEGIWDVPIYKIVNYTVENGEYEIKLVPSGVILQNDKNVVLPREIVFSLVVNDDRSINLVFGS